MFKKIESKEGENLLLKKKTGVVNNIVDLAAAFESESEAVS
jgi:hypothetical protein